MRLRETIAAVAVLMSLATCSMGQAYYSPPPTTTTYPSVAPSNIAGTKGVPWYSAPDGGVYFDILDPIPTGSNHIGNVGQFGAPWSVNLNTAVTTSGTLQSAVSATGNGSTLNVYGYTTAIFTVTGTGTFTVTFQGSADGTNYSNLNATLLGASTISTSTTDAGSTITQLWQVSLGGCIKYIQAPVTWTSGTSVTVVADAAIGDFTARTVTANAGSGTFAIQGVSGGIPVISDINALPTSLAGITLASTTGNVTLTGYFTDINGAQLTSLQTFTITTTATTLTALYNTANSVSPSTTPLTTSLAGVVGFDGSLSGTVYRGRGGKTDGTITSGMTPGAGYPTISGGITFGRIG